MCDLNFINVSQHLQYGKSVIELIHKNNPTTTQIIDEALYVREDVLHGICPQLDGIKEGKYTKLIEETKPKPKKGK